MSDNIKTERIPRLNFQLDTDEPATLFLEEFRRFLNLRSLAEAARVLIKKGYEIHCKEQEILHQN